MKNIKVVTAVARVPFSELSGMMRTGQTSVRIPDVTWEEIPIKVPASLTIEDKEEDKNTLYSSTLVFYTCMSIINRKHYAWKVTLSNGQSLLLGSYERPFCYTAVKETSPESMTDNMLNEVTVTYSSYFRVPAIA